MRIPFSAYDFFGSLASGFVVLAAVDFAFDGRWLLRDELSPVFAVLWTVSAYTIGHMVAHLSSVFLEHWVLRQKLGSPERHVFGEERDRKLWRFLFPGNFKALPRATLARIRKRASEENVDVSERAFFHHCHPIVKRDPATLERLSSFLNLYGFSRNMSMAALLSVVILAAGAAREFDAERMWDSLHGDKLWAAAAAMTVAIGMFYRYLKFFRHYTVEVFTTYAETRP